MPILFTKIQFHDPPAAFTVAEFFLAVAAEFSFRFRYVAVQRFLQVFRDAAPRNDIAYARIPTSTMQARSLSSSDKIRFTRNTSANGAPDTLPFAVCAPSEARPVPDSGRSPAMPPCRAEGAISAPLPRCHSDRPSGVSRLHEYTITDKHPKNRNPAANPIPVNSFLKKPISHTSSGYSLA